MTIIVLKNGTTSINIECAGLTYLEYCEDDNIYRCEYSDWTFGLFAMLGVVALLVPIVMIIHCSIKWYYKRIDEHFRPNISRQTSYSSLYPHEVEPECSSHEKDVIIHHPKKKNKGYYPYPAYGTHDDASLLGSTASLYNIDASDGRSSTASQAIPPAPPPPAGDFPTQSAHSNAAVLPYLSSSCPVVTSKLKGFRDALHKEGKPQQDEDCGPEYSSLGKNQNRLFHQSIPFPSDDGASGGQPSSFSTTGNDTSSETSIDSETDSLMESFVAERSSAKVPHARNSPPHQLNLIPVHVDKNRILSATPPSNMVTRQDFDDYLADCVLKLPEDQRNGLFLIRNSTSVSNCKVLTLYSKSLENNASLYYFKIYLKDDGGCLLEGTDVPFESINFLIEHYRKNRAVLPCLLTECLGKNF